MNVFHLGQGHLSTPRASQAPPFPTPGLFLPSYVRPCSGSIFPISELSSPEKLPQTNFVMVNFMSQPDWVQDARIFGQTLFWVSVRVFLGEIPMISSKVFAIRLSQILWIWGFDFDPPNWAFRNYKALLKYSTCTNQRSQHSRLLSLNKLNIFLLLTLCIFSNNILPRMVALSMDKRKRRSSFYLIWKYHSATNKTDDVYL